MADKDIRETVLSLVKAEEETLKDKEAPVADKPVDYTFLQECFYANELGDGTYYAHLFRGKYVFAKKLKKWLLYNGYHWEYDYMEQVYHGVEEVALAYLDYSYQLQKMAQEERAKGPDASLQKIARFQKEKESYYKRASLLRATNRPEACLRYAHRIQQAPLAITGDEIDNQPWLLACKNGVVDLRTGAFRPGKPEDYLVKACPHKWPEEGIDTPTPIFDEFLRDVFEPLPDYTGDKEKYRDNITSFLLRALGYSITGLSTERFFLILFGEYGFNGKGTLVELLKYILGPLAGPIQPEMLLDSKMPRQSSAASPDVMALKGLRIAFASETDDNRRFSTAKIKWFTGADTLTARDLQADFISWIPTHSLILLTNYLPHAPADDNAFWGRLNLIDFKWSFVANPVKAYEKKRDDSLLEKLKAEAPGILAKLVKGCLEWQHNGLKPPVEIMGEKDKYRYNEDVVARFITACAWTDDGEKDHHETFSNIYKEFETWFSKFEGRIESKAFPSKKRIGMLLSKKFKKEEGNGAIAYHGLRLKQNASDL